MAAAMSSNDQSHRVRFGPYEADLRTHELWKHGTRLKLSGQPFQILEVMLGRPGELITRDELRDKLWPEDTFVDFQHGLNAAINKLRDALSDSADNPRYIETLPRRGYRFLGVVEQATLEPAERRQSFARAPLAAAPQKSEPPVFEQIVPDEGGRWRRVALTSVLLVIVLALLAVYVDQWMSREQKRFDEKSRLEPISLETSAVVQVGVGSAAGKHRAIGIGAGRNESPQLSPDGQHLAFMSDRSGSMEIWVSGADGSNPVQMTDLGGTGSPRWSPNSKMIAFDGHFQNHGAIFVVPVAGGLAKPLIREEHEDLVPNFSRDGRWIYYASDASGIWQVWKVPTEGGRQQQVTTHGGFFAQEGADGYLYYADSNMPNPRIWRMPLEGGEEARIFPSIAPRDWASWAVAPDGIYFVEDSAPSVAVLSFYDFARRDLQSKGLLGKPPFWLSISPDSKWLLMGPATEI
jgi:DNA-binding winged helix-turn-helix (wHTH) protein